MEEQDHGMNETTAEFAFGARTPRDRAGDLSHDDAVRYRTTYEGSPHRIADRSYEDVRPAYRLGHLAGGNPDYHGKAFETVEDEIQRGWSGDLTSRYGAWDAVSLRARHLRAAGVSHRT